MYYMSCDNIASCVFTARLSFAIGAPYMKVPRRRRVQHRATIHARCDIIHSIAHAHARRRRRRWLHSRLITSFKINSTNETCRHRRCYCSCCCVQSWTGDLLVGILSISSLSCRVVSNLSANMRSGCCHSFFVELFLYAYDVSMYSYNGYHDWFGCW